MLKNLNNVKEKEEINKNKNIYSIYNLINNINIYIASQPFKIDIIKSKLNQQINQCSKNIGDKFSILVPAKIKNKIMQYNYFM